MIENIKDTVRKKAEHIERIEDLEKVYEATEYPNKLQDMQIRSGLARYKALCLKSATNKVLTEQLRYMLALMSEVREEGQSYLGTKAQKMRG